MKYYYAGNRGLVGRNYNELVPGTGGNTDTVDYTSYRQTKQHIMIAGATHVVVNAATVGGLLEDLDRSFELMLRNLKIQNNLFEACAELEIDRVLLQGSTCSYPEEGPQPFHELQLMEGKPYDGYLTTALPKLVGMYQCRASNDKRGTSWRTAICTNMFGPGDRVGEHAHVIGALMQKFLTATREDHTEIEIWGSGKPLREFLYVLDLADCIKFIIESNLDEDLINVGSGEEISIEDLATLISEILNFKGDLVFNTEMPDGNPRKLLDSTLIKSYGWSPSTSLEKGLRETINWYLTSL